MPERTDRARDGVGWQIEAGYSRAARRGRRIAVSGTTATGPNGAALYPGDTYAQTKAALERGIRAIEALGGRPADVLRSRLYLAPGANWTEAGRAHKELLGAVAPANTTLFVAGLIGQDFLVEIGLEAELDQPA
jgi:enamine deaminase RidA (YjgF/YER057c/UK114 family)